MDIDNASDDSDINEDGSVHGAAAPAVFSPGKAISRSTRLRISATDDEEDDEEDDDDEDEDHDDEDHHIQRSLLRASSSSLGNTASRSFVTASRGERYLHASNKPAKTSSNKLSDAIHQPFTQKSILKALIRHSTSTKGKATLRQLREIEQAYMQLFPQWLAELQQGYTLLFHGFGSKIRLLNLFVQTSLRQSAASKRVLLLDGFKADLSILDLVAALESLLVPEDELRANPLYSAKTASRIDERVSHILEALANINNNNDISPEKPLYLILHSLDGPSLRSPRAQATIWTLANHPSIRLIASFDHVRAPLLFSPSHPTAPSSSSEHQPSSGTINPIVYHHVPTLRPYTAEALSSGCLSSLYPQTVFLSEMHLLQSKQGGMRNASSSSRAKAAAFVLASLTQKAKDLFQMIASQQMARVDGEQAASLDHSGQTPALALPYPTLFTSARDAFLANNVGQMEALLREFRDHEIILSSNVAPIDHEADALQTSFADLGQKGSEWLWINIASPDLQALVDRLQLG